jgi:ABC-2 type transport system permease protein
MKHTLVITRLEILRVFRNKRYLIFTLALPVGMYLLFGTSKNSIDNSGQTANLFYMISMSTLGAFSGSLMGSANRISTERKAGWTRQLRLSALPSWSYMVGKMAAALATSIPSVVLVMLLGHFVGGVDMAATKWIYLALVIWLGSAVFAALSVAVGYRFDPDTIQPVTIGIYLPMVLLGGIYFAFKPDSFMGKFATWLPTFRVTQISGHVVGGTSVPLSALWVLLGWLALFVGLAILSIRTAYRQES